MAILQCRMERQINQVIDFMNLFGQEVKQKIDWPTPAIAELRVSLLEEEVKELREAIEQQDLVGVLDALTDIRYVLDGAIAAFGMQEIAPVAFNEVHESNMTKACATHKEALATQKKYNDEGIMTLIHEKDGIFLVKRLSDGKVLKSINWQEQDLPGLLNIFRSRG